MRQPLNTLNVSPSDVSMVASGFFSLALPGHSEKHPSEAQGVSFLAISKVDDGVGFLKNRARNEEWTKDRRISMELSFVCFFKYDVIYDSMPTSKQGRNDTGE